MYKNLVKPLLFKLNTENAHHFSMAMLTFAIHIPGVAWFLKQCFKSDDSCKRVTICGIEFPNVVGLAAGFDKDARWLRELDVLGFGHVEIGTVTPLAQPGNPLPRLFRLPQDSALLNRMGFNNGGVQSTISRLKNRPVNLIVGGNIGRNKITSNELAASDYIKCFDALYPYVDYFTVNVSSPNTPGLRELQDREPLAALLREVVQCNLSKAFPRPIFLKIAPDLTDGQLDDVVSIISEEGVDGLIATNTTVSRKNLSAHSDDVEALGSGGISGAPVRSRSTEVIQYIYAKSGGSFPIIGVGGIDSVASAQEKLDAGASLVQIYSGMIYEGPSLVKRIANGVQ